MITKLRHGWQSIRLTRVRKALIAVPLSFVRTNQS
jgi:hypothetical protein